MKACSTALKGHLDGEVTTLATLWRLVRRDGAVMAFTDHDRDIIHDGLTYKAATGFTPTSVVSVAGLSVDSLDIQSVLDSAEITEDDLMAGVYDGATVEIFMVNHADPAMGVLFARKGVIGEVTLTGQGFVAELRGLTGALSQTIGQLYSPICRADIGDDRCRVGLTAYTVDGSVAVVLGRRAFGDPARTEPQDWFAQGLLTWLSGANAGMAMEVKGFGAGGAFELFLPMPRDVVVGDRYRVHAGCDRRFITCRGKFANAVNFQGEPHIPGIDYLVEAAGR